MSGANVPNGRAELQRFRIASLPSDFYYIPNFITPEEEASIMGKIPAQRWVTLSHRRLQAHPSTLLKGHTLLASALPNWLNKPVVDRFRALGIFEETPHHAPNHVLINEYNRGEGIMPHEDGATYAPVVATVSLGASICLKITKKPSELDNKADAPSTASLEPHDDADEQYTVPIRILQEPRSLLITTGTAYRDLLHGIEDVEADEDLRAETVANWALLAGLSSFENAGGRNERGTRVSLTYRDVLKVSTAASKVLGGLAKR